MKRFIAVFGVIVIITMHCLSFYPAKAAITSVDYGEMLNTYLGAAETALAASQGVTIDWSNLELPDGSDTWTDKEKAQYIVQYIGNLKKVGQHAIYEWLFGEDNDTFDIVSAQTAAIGLSNNSNLNTQDIKAQLDNILATHSQDHVFQKYSDKVIARWNEYNTNYINDYLDDINSISGEIPSVNPDINYISFIDKINNDQSDGFFWKDYNFLSQNGYSLFTGSSYSNYTFIRWLNSSGSSIVYNYNNNYISSGVLVSNMLNCYINTTGVDLYSVSFSDYTFLPLFKNLYSNIDTYGGYFTDDIASSNLTNYPDASNYRMYYNNHTLTECFNWINTNFRNVNIFVNGQAWSLPNYDIDSNITVSVPNAVIDSGTDDGKIVAHPIYYPDAMNTDKAIDIDLDKVVDAIASRIAAGDTDITFDDLVDAGAAVKLDGNTLTDADTIVQDVSVPIARARVDTIDGVIPTIDVVPPLPPLPPLTPGDYSGEGFSGMSVLARIINATVQGLPAPLILTFFGVVFGAVILGIIKILHH